LAAQQTSLQHWLALHRLTQTPLTQSWHAPHGGSQGAGSGSGGGSGSVFALQLLTHASIDLNRRRPPEQNPAFS
jgi:hypothetical protein